MNLPHEMFLKTIGGEVKLCVLPVKETELLYTAEEHFTNVSVSTNQPFKYLVSSKCCDITLSVPVQNSFAFTLFGFDVSYDTVNTEIFVDSGSIFMGMTYMQDNLKRMILRDIQSGNS